MTNSLNADDADLVDTDFIDTDTVHIDRVLSTTRSVRRKLDFERPVEQQVIEDCISIATQAPVGMGGENWRFLVVRDERKKSQVAGVYQEVMHELTAARGISIKATHQALMDRMHEMPALIFVCVIGQPESSYSSNVAFFGSILPAAWSLMLALRARGIGTTWTSLLSAREAEIAGILDIPEGAMQTVMLPIAYTKDARLKPADRLAAGEVTFVDTWGSR